MKIALIGYGKMGKTIESLAIERGHKIIARSSSESPIEETDLSSCDVAIEFSTPELAVKHIEYCIDSNIPIIVGTTAWNEQLDYVKDLVSKKNGSLLHASNFSIGVNIFFDINKRLAKLMSTHSEYQVEMTETHHTQKLDAPSGTAVSLANDILFENENTNSWIHNSEEKPHSNRGQLAVTSFRRENVPGTHNVIYSSEIDEIEIKHTAHSRKGFALGAIIAAEWLKGRKGIFTMQDIIKL